MLIGKSDVKSVVANKIYKQASQVLGHRFGIQRAIAAPFIAACGTRTILTQIPKRKNTAMTVLPGNS
jgi:hypothetical protein